MPRQINEMPRQLCASKGICHIGSYIMGPGFTFEDSTKADSTTPGQPSPLANMEQIIAENPSSEKALIPYIGGREVNHSPTHQYTRYVIDFQEKSYQECATKWPELIDILRLKARPERIKAGGWLIWKP